MGDAFAAFTKLQWKLCNSVPAIEWRPKTKKKQKVFAQKWSVFSPKSEVKIKKKKRSLPQFRTIAYSAGICEICSFWLDLFRLIIQRSNLDEWTSKSQRGGAKSRWEDANSRWRDASPLQFRYWLRLLTMIIALAGFTLRRAPDSLRVFATSSC